MTNPVPPTNEEIRQGANPAPMQRIQTAGAKNIDNVLQDVQKILGERMHTHGDPGCFAEVFAGMLRPYLQGMMYAARPFLDVDSFAVLEIMKLARQSVAAQPLDNAARIDAVGYAVLNAAYMWQPPKVKSGEELFQELLAWAKDEKALEGIDFPDHWTMAEVRSYVDYKRAREKRDMEEKEKLRILERERAAQAHYDFHAEAIPEGVYYSPVHDNFYDADGGGKGPGFYNIWAHRAGEFPTRHGPVMPDAGNGPSLPGDEPPAQEGSESTAGPQEDAAGLVDSPVPFTRPTRGRRLS
jgi:hypothetical protein